ncbi:recombinase family protein [Oscillibacter sp.]|jgi:DNA invertase Pin-like site-specific DNA recombinase|uniref:recombinase family protein n=1 Tax=Oscillibacter sp. TaxID=1945593 RepID=UPI0028964455|nr:recombinase family protein [Oscillibacter sp.]
MTKTITSTNPRLRAAAYCRIAGGEEPNTVLESQRTCYAKQIGANPDWIMAGIFADTSDCRSKRPEFQKMLRKCRQGKIDLILVSTFSRFARSTADGLNIIRELRELGVAVVFEKEAVNTSDPDSDWYISIMGAIARAESESISHGACGICTCRFHHMITSSPRKRTQKKTIRFPGRPEKTIIVRME